MRPAAEATLRLLADNELSLTPNNIAENTGYKAGTIRNELTELLAKGLVEKKTGPGDPFYTITKDGRDYLAGELDASGLEGGNE